RLGGDGAPADGDHVVEDPPGDVHAGGLDAVPELHGVVDLTHQQAVRVLQDVDGQHAATDGAGRGPRQLVDLRGDRAVAGAPAAGGVGDPVVGLPIDGADGLVADHEAANVPGDRKSTRLNSSHGSISY